MEELENSLIGLLPTLEERKSEINEQNIHDKINQYKEEREENYKSLLRIVIEFCQQIGDPELLFNDLYEVFKKENLREMFMNHLRQFIIAGQFRKWKTSNEVLQRYLKYYKQHCSPYIFGQVIVGFNFKECNAKIVIELIRFSEQNSLSTALFYIYSELME